MKTLALFGATGKTGRQFLDQALAAGYRMRALVRDPAKLPVQHPNLEVIGGDVLNPDDVARTVAGTEVVVSLFGHVKGSPEWLQTNGTRHIVQAMQQHGVRKIISLSGGGLPYEQDRPKLPDYLIRGIMKLAVPKVLNDAIRHAELLQASGLDWLIVRGPRLTDEPRRGQYRVGWVGVNASTKVGRADLAAFILQQVEDNGFVHKMPFVSY
ncbi:NAD(P)-dependent oxidoreductase [Hymenobacter latericus]|uniref:NAD(P)-dependent oxidoreductase n=1 Tax=Hymenobacter sp. YIM 151858-1 TaxID=2987688 RepID=UPI0022274F8D|nr:SDR family oxidoreductase [Hymenobacter sp. YIM 151858-1]UYZ60054.1 SDR family oxidoreductase [Hymenobacter sp. YIM 151858-1]